VEAFPLVPIFAALQEGKKVVITGHSLGGACAMVLTTKFFNTYGQFDYDNGQVQCVTFGSPLIGDCSVAGYLYKRAMHFHNYILEDDLVPLSLTILGDVASVLISQARLAPLVGAAANAAKDHFVSYSPFGQFYYLKSSNETLPSDLVPMTTTELGRYFHTFNYVQRINGKKNISDHAMDNYKNALLFGLKTALPRSPGGPRPLTASPVPTITACFVKDTAIVVTGTNLAYCNVVSLLGYDLRV
jgi:hypothetical protein